MVVTPMSALGDVGAYWQGQGGIWGGAFNDPIHFEYPGFKAQTDTNILAATSDAVFDWINSLPWYVQLIIPKELMTSKTPDPQKIMAIIRKAGY